MNLPQRVSIGDRVVDPHGSPGVVVARYVKDGVSMATVLYAGDDQPEWADPESLDWPVRDLRPQGGDA